MDYLDTLKQVSLDEKFDPKKKNMKEHTSRAICIHFLITNYEKKFSSSPFVEGTADGIAHSIYCTTGLPTG